jgi:hypothetical protein
MLNQEGSLQQDGSGAAARRDWVSSGVRFHHDGWLLLRELREVESVGYELVCGLKLRLLLNR